MGKYNKRRFNGKNANNNAPVRNGNNNNNVARPSTSQEGQVNANQAHVPLSNNNHFASEAGENIYPAYMVTNVERPSTTSDLDTEVPQAKRAKVKHADQNYRLTQQDIHQHKNMLPVKGVSLAKPFLSDHAPPSEEVTRKISEETARRFSRTSVQHIVAVASLAVFLKKLRFSTNNLELVLSPEHYKPVLLAKYSVLSTNRYLLMSKMVPFIVKYAENTYSDENQDRLITPGSEEHKQLIEDYHQHCKRNNLPKEAAYEYLWNIVNRKVKMFSGLGTVPDADSKRVTGILQNQPDLPSLLVNTMPGQDRLAACCAFMAATDIHSLSCPLHRNSSLDNILTEVDYGNIEARVKMLEDELVDRGDSLQNIVYQFELLALRLGVIHDPQAKPFHHSFVPNNSEIGENDELEVSVIAELKRKIQLDNNPLPLLVTDFGRYARVKDTSHLAKILLLLFYVHGQAETKLLPPAIQNYAQYQNKRGKSAPLGEIVTRMKQRSTPSDRPVKVNTIDWPKVHITNLCIPCRQNNCIYTEVILQSDSRATEALVPAVMGPLVSRVNLTQLQSHTSFVMGLATDSSQRLNQVLTLQQQHITELQQQLDNINNAVRQITEHLPTIQSIGTQFANVSEWMQNLSRRLPPIQQPPPIGYQPSPPPYSPTRPDYSPKDRDLHTPVCDEPYDMPTLETSSAAADQQQSPSGQPPQLQPQDGPQESLSQDQQDTHNVITLQ